MLIPKYVKLRRLAAYLYGVLLFYISTLVDLTKGHPSTGNGSGDTNLSGLRSRVAGLKIEAENIKNKLLEECHLILDSETIHILDNQQHYLTPISDAELEASTVSALRVQTNRLNEYKLYLNVTISVGRRFSPNLRTLLLNHITNIESVQISILLALQESGSFEEFPGGTVHTSQFNQIGANFAYKCYGSYMLIAGDGLKLFSKLNEFYQ